MDDTDFYNAKRWCKSQKAEMVSINSEDENKFVWQICHTEPRPFQNGNTKSRAPCWLGMREKPGTGSAETVQEDQMWEWLDGTNTTGNKYANWGLRPGMGNGDGDGNRYFEPNNEKTRRTPFGQDVRHAIMNQKEGGMSGYWYDKPAAFRAHSVCEKEAETPFEEAF